MSCHSLLWTYKVVCYWAKIELIMFRINEEKGNSLYDPILPGQSCLYIVGLNFAYSLIHAMLMWTIKNCL